jgi:hypothetical protein
MSRLIAALSDFIALKREPVTAVTVRPIKFYYDPLSSPLLIQI